MTGLAVGDNVLTARLRSGASAKLTIVDHPNGGPVFSGPQVQPWKCQGTATDAQCNEPVSYGYQYKSSLTGQLGSYDPASPPPDVARTTTDQGKTVPFIVRTETGYQDRDQYKITVLYDPAKPWTAWSPQQQWNHKLLITHGASCGIEHQSGSAPSTTGDTVAGGSPTEALGRGFAVMSTALDNAGHNCNLATEAESLVMAKERLVERYGEIRYTIGTGCSGGSLVQQQVANAYPGIYQGILPQCSFPDAWSTGQQLAAYHLIRQYVENPTKWAPGVVWSPADIAAVEGHPNHVNSIVFDSVYWTDLGVPDDGCAGVPAEQNYNADTNPGGVRCGLADYMINVLGPRPQSVWTAPEKKVGHGFAGLPLGDVGVQFGLEALQKGQITPAQFVDLNAKIGGTDIDINSIPQRSEPDEPALRERLSQRRHQRDQQPHLGPDHRSAWPRPGRVPRHLSDLDDPRSARAPGGPLPAQSRHLVRPCAADRRPELHHRGPDRDGPLAGEGRGRPSQRAAVPQGGRGPAERRERPLLADRRGRERLPAGRRKGLRAEGGPDPLRHPGDGGRRGCGDRQEQVRA